jgi:hypothetical protein
MTFLINGIFKNDIFTQKPKIKYSSVVRKNSNSKSAGLALAPLSQLAPKFSLICCPRSQDKHSTLPNSSVLSDKKL